MHTEFVAFGPAAYFAGDPTPGYRHGRALHASILSYRFRLQRTEVTQAQWRDVTGMDPSYHEACPDCPVEQVTWWDAVTFANLLSERHGLASCYVIEGCEGENTPGRVCRTVEFVGLGCEGFRLPTETEWEYVAHAGSVMGIPCHRDDWDCIGGYAWWWGTTTDYRTQPVLGRLPNDWDVWGLIGNVSEWVWDCYSEDDAGVDWPMMLRINSTGAATNTCTDRVLRGACAGDAQPALLVPATRGAFPPTYSSRFGGFRLARTMSLSPGLGEQ